MPDYMTLRELADELGIHHSVLRKYIVKNSISTISVRPRGGHGQQAHALTLDDAKTVRALREQQGFGTAGPSMDTGPGLFYLVQVVPDLDSHRIKLGFTCDMEARLGTYRCVSPTADLVKSWPCNRAWEVAAIASITRLGCRLIANEVFQCDYLDQVIKQGDEFFALMPSQRS